tara:strand:- start:2839 stop:3570 length:732 start_codon:yes stop_codon:yes gene_type:complete
MNTPNDREVISAVRGMRPASVAAVVFAAIVVWPYAFWLNLTLFNGGRTLFSGLIPPTIVLVFVAMLGTKLIRTSQPSRAAVPILWAMFWSAFIMWLDWGGIAYLGMRSGGWVLHYVVCALAALLPLLLVRRPQSSRSMGERIATWTICTAMLASMLTTLGPHDRFVQSLAQCDVGMTGERWLEVFDGYTVSVHAADREWSVLVSPDTKLPWSDVESVSPKPGFGGSFFDFERGQLSSISVNLD